MTDILSSSMSDPLTPKLSINDQLKELATKIKEVTDSDTVTISYTVPMNQTKECKVNINELQQEGNDFLVAHALTCKYNKLSSLLEEMNELLQKV